MKNEEWLERDKAALASVLPRVHDVVFMRGKGSWLVDVEQERYLDFSSGIAVNSTGHCHPKVVEAIQHQASMLIHTSVVGHNMLNIQLAERIGKLCPFFEEPQVFFCNSGAEAVDGSMKLARMVTGRPGVIAFSGGFHGRTLAATSLTTAKDKYWSGYEPLLDNVYIVPYNGSITPTSQVLNQLFRSQAIGAVIVEPVLGEGGYVVPDKGWLFELRYTCDEHNALLIFDEVQTGIGRTGYPFAAETFGVTPDVILFAKGIASGLPLGGIIASRTIMDQWPEGTHGSTFGGNPVSCAAAIATLDILDDYCLFNVRKMHKKAMARLEQWSPRGVGYMIGIPTASKRLATTLQKFCLDNGLLALTCGPDENIIRLMPPLTVTDHEWEIALEILERGLNKCLIDDVLKYAV